MQWKDSLPRIGPGATAHSQQSHLELSLSVFYHASGQADKLAQTKEDRGQELDDWLHRAGDTTDAIPEEEHLLGSWAQLNADRPRSAVFVGVCNATCAFAKAKQFPIAERLFRVLQEKGRPATGCGEALFLLSCWENRHSRDEIVDWLCTSVTLTIKDLKRFVPELIDAVTGKRADFA